MEENLTPPVRYDLSLLLPKVPSAIKDPGLRPTAISASSTALLLFPSNNQHLHKYIYNKHDLYVNKFRTFTQINDVSTLPII